MDDLFVTLIAIVVSSLVLGVIGFFMVLGLRTQVKELRARLELLELGARGTAASEQRPDAARASDTTKPVSAPWPIPRSAKGEGRGMSEALAPKDPGQQRPAAPSQIAQLTRWMTTNWIYPVAGLALVLAGVFLVQYSVEQNLLTPRARVFLAVALGMALIFAGEYLRRRIAQQQAERLAEEGPSSEEPADASPNAPNAVQSTVTGAGLNVAATLAGAGAVALFSAVLAAYHLYDMLGQNLAFGALVILTVLTLFLGWVHGPLLAALGLVVGCAVPFSLGSGEKVPQLLYAYYPLLALAGLAIGGVRKWSLISLCAALLPGLAIVVLKSADPGVFNHILALGLSALAAMALPSGTLIPTGQGIRLSQLRRQTLKQADTVVWASWVASALFWISLFAQGAPLPAIGALMFMSILLVIWTSRAPALADLPLAIVVLALIAAIYFPLAHRAELSFAQWVMPDLIVPLLTFSVLTGLAFLWRSRREISDLRQAYVIAGLAFPGAVLIVLSVFWGGAQRLGNWPWASIAMVFAAGYTFMAIRFSKEQDQDSATRLSIGLAASGAGFAIALALFQVLSTGALTLALGVLLALVAFIDRRLDIPAIHSVVITGVGVLLYRFLVDPGYEWLIANRANVPQANLFDLALSLVGMLGGLGAAWILSDQMPQNPLRNWSRFLLQSTLIAVVPMSVNLLLQRFVWPGNSSHQAFLGIQAATWSLVAYVQMRRISRADQGRVQQLICRILATLYALGAFVAGALILTYLMPIFLGSKVSGWPVFNDLLLGYLAPAMALAWLSRRITGWPDRVVQSFAAIMAAAWVGLNIRFVWRGVDEMRLHHGFEQGELYTYTLAILISGALAIALALRTGIQSFRLAGLGLIALAVAKAFLVDVSGLDGLLRVGAFLALGLSLAGLAWLNTWVRAQMESEELS